MKARPTTWRHDLALALVMALLFGCAAASKVYGWALGKRRA